MAKSRLGATCAAVLLALTFVSAQTGAVKAPRTATLSGCVVRDAANGGKATIESNGISYMLTARNGQHFEQYLGKKVEVTGALMTGETERRATSGKTDELGAPKDQVPLATDKGTTADLTGRIDVKTIKTVAGSCL